MSDPIGEYADVDAIYAAQQAELAAMNAEIQEESDFLDAEEAEDRRVADEAEAELQKLERMVRAALNDEDDDDGYFSDNVTPITAARSWNGGGSAGM